MKPYDLSQYMYQTSLATGAGLMGFAQTNTYAPGTIGEALKNLGAAGPGAGGSGVVTTEYMYNANTVTSPAIGEIRFDTAPPNTATNMKVSQTTAGGVDVGLAYSYLAPGQRVYIQQKDDATRYVKATVIGTPVDQGDWWLFPILVTEASVPTINEVRCVIGWPASAASGSGTPTNVIPKGGTGTGFVNSQFFDDGINVGLGTGTPASKLHVKGSGLVVRMETATARGLGQNSLAFYDPSGLKGYVGYTTDDNLWVSNALSGAVVFGVNNAETARIDATAVRAVNFAASGNVTAYVSMSIGDVNHSIQTPALGPYHIVDNGDYWRFARASNTFEWVIGESSRMQLDATTLGINGNFHAYGGTVYSVDAQTSGNVNCAGNITGAAAVFSGTSGAFYMQDQGSNKVLNFVPNTFMQYEGVNTAISCYVNGGLSWACNHDKLMAPVFAVGGFSTTYYLNQDARYANVNVDANDWFRFDRNTNRYEFIIGNGVQSFIGAGEAQIGGGVIVTSVLSVGDNIYANNLVTFRGQGLGCGAQFLNPTVGHDYRLICKDAVSTGALQFTNETLGIAYMGFMPDGQINVYRNHICNADIFAPNIPTTGAGPNLFVAGGPGQVLRSTSSIRYKTNVEDIVEPGAVIDQLRAVSYTSLCEGDDPERVFLGLIAEEVELVDKNFINYNEKDEPEGLNYQAFIPLIIKEIQFLRARLAAVEAR